MKKIIILLMLVSPIFVNARGGVSCSHSSFSSHVSTTHSFSTRSYCFKPSSSSIRTQSTVKPSIHVNSVRTVGKLSEPIKLTNSVNSPHYNSMGCSKINNNYEHLYHYHHINMFWYWLYFNKKTHTYDTIKAKTKSELDSKVKYLKI